MESLQRIYGISFPDPKMLKEWEKFQEEAKNRDHRKLGRVRTENKRAKGGATCPMTSREGCEQKIVISFGLCTWSVFLRALVSSS